MRNYNILKTNCIRISHINISHKWAVELFRKLIKVR